MTEQEKLEKVILGLTVCSAGGGALLGIGLSL